MTNIIASSAAGALALVSLGGCATSQMALSRPIGAAPARGDTPTHVYFLPKGMVTAKISGTPGEKRAATETPGAFIAPQPGRNAPPSQRDGEWATAGPAGCEGGAATAEIL